MTNLFLEKRGRTIHLLKKQSKPVPHNNKRRKFALGTTPEEFAAKDKALQEESQPMQIDQIAAEDKSDKATGPRKGRGKAVNN